MEHRATGLARISDIDLKLIRLFITVADNGGFTAAVPALGISRSAISLHMTDLENRLGLRLCERGRGGFALTHEGRELYKSAQQALASMEDFRDEINSLKNELCGTLNIGITDNLVSLSQMTVTEALATLKKRGPDVRINIDMRPSSEIESGVLEGRFHVGVVPHVRRLSSLYYRPLYQETAYLYAIEGHPLTFDPDNLDDDAIESADAVHPTHALPDTARTCYERLANTASANDREGVAFLILTGRYIGFLPEHFAQRFVDSGWLCRLKPQEWHYSIDYVMITQRNRRYHRVLDCFLDAIGFFE